MNDWFVEQVIFKHPCTIIIAGPTKSGKTYLVKNILKNNELLIEPMIERIFYCYKVWQPIFDQFKKDCPNLEFIDGILDTNILNPEVKNLIILDDLMKECLKKDEVMDLFTVDSHHKNTTVIYITQNFFSCGKYARDISVNTHYIVLFNNPRDCLQISYLGRQMFPNNSKFLSEAYEDATSKPHGYILLDLTQGIDGRNRITTNILPGEKRIIYTPK